MNADYITNPLYENNPFIEALPPMLAGKDLIRALASIPPYSDNDRDRSTGERLQLLSSLYEYYQPLSMTIDLYCEVYTALQHCYGQYSVQRETAALQNDYPLTGCDWGKYIFLLHFQQGAPHCLFVNVGSAGQPFYRAIIGIRARMDIF